MTGIALVVAASFVPLAAEPEGGPKVRIGFDASVWPTPVSGRLVVLMKARRFGDATGEAPTPLDGPDWEEEHPIFAVDVKDLAPGAWVEVGAAADAFPAPMDKLAPGEYVVQARLDTQRTDSNWRRENGNLYSSGRAYLTIDKAKPGATAEIKLDAVTKEPERAAQSGVEWFSVRSALLSDFRKREVVLRAGVVLPKGYDPKAQYAAVYLVPGFGGDDRSVGVEGLERAGEGLGALPERPFGKREPAQQAAAEALSRSTFWIVLDPEGPNGHTLFCDSANNGPCGRALVEELIPALEKKYPLVARPEARLLRGHSSGGWSTLWLATEYRTVFGACWSTSPDPVDFRRFQLCDIYAAHWFYGFPVNGLRAGEAHAFEAWARTVPQGVIPAAQGEGPGGVDRLVSYRSWGRAVMTVEREARGEDLLGPDNTSGQQWDSWFAAWGGRNERGNPSALFDPATGVIDRAAAERMRAFDIAHRLRSEPAVYGPVFRDRIRLVVGGADNFFLNEAVALLKEDVRRTFAAGGGEGGVGGGAGYITIVPDTDHGSVLVSPQVRAFGAQMVEHLRASGLLREAPAAEPTR